MNNISDFFVSLLFWSCFSMILAGCTTGPFSGSASMIIEVEVYKGPLSEEPEIQWGAILGQLEDVERSFMHADNFTRAVIAHKDFKNVGLNDYSDIDKLPMDWPVPRIRKRLETGNILFNKGSLQIDIFKEMNSIEKVELNNKLSRILNEFNSGSDVFKAKDNNFSLKHENLYNQNDGKLNNLCEYLDPEGLWDVIDTFDCLILTTLVRDTSDIRKKIIQIRKSQPTWFVEGATAPFNNLAPANVKVFLSQISRLSISLKDSAFRWAVASAAGQSLNFFVRIALVNSIVTASEAGNRLKNRADALMKQITPGLDRRELSPSVALREAEPTDFVNLYKWLDATSHSFVSKYIQGIGSVSDRIKIIERLFGDHHWSKINTVYASGRGNVSMAFIKDDVGNWNLKSFDNDPADLLQAYTTFSIEAIKKATELVAAGSSGGTTEVTDLAINQLIKMANQSSFNNNLSTEKSEITGVLSGLNMSVVHQITEIQSKLKKLKKLESFTKKDKENFLNEIKVIIETHSSIVDGIGKGLVQQQPH